MSDAACLNVSDADADAACFRTPPTTGSEFPLPKLRGKKRPEGYNVPLTPTSGTKKNPRRLTYVEVERLPMKPLVAERHYPKYSIMITAALHALKEVGGSSRQAILKYIMATYKVGTEVAKVNIPLKAALKAGVKAGTLKQTKGTGASGSFRMAEKVATEPRKAKKPQGAAGRKSPKKADKAPKKADKAPKKADKAPKKADKAPKKADKAPKKADKSSAKPQTTKRAPTKKAARI